MKDAASSRALIEAVTARTGYANLTGIRITDVAPGSVEMDLPWRPELTQADGYFHGGVIAGLADHAAGAAVVSALPESRFCLTVALTMNFLAPASGEQLRVHAETVQVSSSLGTATARVYSQAQNRREALCAIATATMRAIDMPAKPGRSVG